jgi:cytochrome c-type biogenesis protein CcmH
MSERARNLLTVALITVMAGALVTLVVTNPSDVDRVESIGERIKCPVCQGEAIIDSPSRMARDMMDLVEERVTEGRSDQTIIDELLGSYSGAVLLDPPISGATLVLWIAPIVAVGLGAGIILWWKRHPAREEAASPRSGDSKPGRLVPLLLLGVAFAAIVVVAGVFIQDREGPATGVADLSDQDLSDVSNETLEAVVASNPEVYGMRLALAERYFSENDFRSAFPHYLMIAEAPEASGSQAVTALVRLGWMAWLSNAEVADALGLFDQALEIDPSSWFALYYKGRVLWCGAGENDRAVELFREVLANPDLPDESRTQVEADLDATDSGASCR